MLFAGFACWFDLFWLVARLLLCGWCLDLWCLCCLIAWLELDVLFVFVVLLFVFVVVSVGFCWVCIGLDCVLILIGK